MVRGGVVRVGDSTALSWCRPDQVRPALIRCAKAGWRGALALLLFALLPLSVAVDWGAGLPTVPSAEAIVAPLPEVSPQVWQSRGQVVESEPYDYPPFDDRDAVLGQGWRATYLSVSGVDGGIREVSGVFFIPRGTPPEQGWPVISMGHGTTGIGHDCGPSRQPDLMGYASLIESLLTAKYAVAVSDFEGLGDSGSHPYLEPRTAAFNTIDAVRALRAMSGTVSTRWMAVGYSQGGQAVWAANELNSYYGQGLQLQGSVSLAPATNLSGVADLVWSGSLTEDQRARFPMFIIGTARFSPGLDPDAFLHGSAEAHREQLSHCGSPDARRAATADSGAVAIPWQDVVDRLRESNDLRPSDPQAIVTLREALRRSALPQRPLDKPMLVMVGEDDAVVLPDWVAAAAALSCAMGGRVQYQEIPDVGHGDLLPRVAHAVDRWIADRFDGKPAPSNCPEPPA